MTQKLKASNSANTDKLFLNILAFTIKWQHKKWFSLCSLSFSPFRGYHQVLDVHQVAMKKVG